MTVATSPVSLVKGQSLNLNKHDPANVLANVLVGLRWDVNQTPGKPAFDLDASAFLLNDQGKVRSDADFIFFNTDKDAAGKIISADGKQGSTCRSVIYSGDNRTGAGDGDDETYNINLATVPADVHRIAFAVTIFEADKNGYVFGAVQNAGMNVYNADLNNTKLAGYDLSEDGGQYVSMLVGELYRDKNAAGEWKFKGLEMGFTNPGGGLDAIARAYGVNI